MHDISPPLAPGPENACFALAQCAHVLAQVIALYPGASVSIYSHRLSTMTGCLLALQKAQDTSAAPLLLLRDTPPYAFAIEKIAVLHLPNSVYEPSITYLPLPEPAAGGLELIRTIHDSVAVGDTLELMTGVTTNAAGIVAANEYGVIVLADASSTMFVFTSHIFSLRVTARAEEARPARAPAIILR